MVKIGYMKGGGAIRCQEVKRHSLFQIDKLQYASAKLYVKDFAS